MFARIKKSGNNEYLQIVENKALPGNAYLGVAKKEWIWQEPSV